MAGLSTWSEEQIDNLLKLYREEVPLKEMAVIIGKSYGSVKGMLTVLRQKGYDVPYRDQKRAQARRRARQTNGEKIITKFDIEYQGPVPCKHWMITKPWRL